MKKIQSELIRFLFIMLGNIIDAIGFTLFVIPSNLTTGGTTGLGLFINTITPFSIAAVIFCINIFMFLIGTIFLGKKFAASTAFSTFFYPFVIWILQSIFQNYTITTDPMLCAIFGGLLIGIGLSLVLRSGSSSGGMDIPPLLLKKYFRVPLSISIYILDVLILLLQSFHKDKQMLLYGIILVLTYSIVLDKLLIIGTSKMQLKIISSKNQEICDLIFQEIDRGVTFLKSKSGYLKLDGEVILTIVSNRELAKIEHSIHKIDPDAFIIINKVSEVKGHGFSLDK